MARRLLELLEQLPLHRGSLGVSASHNAFSVERSGTSPGRLGSGSEGLLLVFWLALLTGTSILRMAP